MRWIAGDEAGGTGLDISHETPRSRGRARDECDTNWRVHRAPQATAAGHRSRDAVRRRARWKAGATRCGPTARPPGCGPPRRAAPTCRSGWRGSLVQRPPRFLQALDPQELPEVLGPVVIAAPDAERWRQQPFLHVIPHRPARDPAEICEIADGVAHGIGHANNMTVNCRIVNWRIGRATAAALASRLRCARRPPSSRGGKSSRLVLSLRSLARRVPDAIQRHTPGVMHRQGDQRRNGSQGRNSPRGIASPISPVAAGRP